MWELHIWYHIVMLHAMVGLHMDPLMWERLKLYIWRIDLHVNPTHDWRHRHSSLLISHRIYAIIFP